MVLHAEVEISRSIMKIVPFIDEALNLPALLEPCIISAIDNVLVRPHFSFFFFFSFFYELPVPGPEDVTDIIASIC